MMHDIAPLHAASADDLPYRFEALDAAMEAAGLDALVATSKHNVRYLLGGYQFIFFSAMDAIGQSRYLPAFVYIRGDAGKTGYFANKMEIHEHRVMPFWVPEFHPDHWGSVDTMQAVAEHLQRCGIASGRIGFEAGFMPKDGFDAVAGALPQAQFTDASMLLTRLRMIKTKTRTRSAARGDSTDQRVDAGDDQGRAPGGRRNSRSSKGCARRKRRASWPSNIAF